MPKIPIQTTHAPHAIGTYSQAIAVSQTQRVIYLSGQIGLDVASMTLVEGIEAQVHQVFANLRAVAIAAGGTLEACVKLNIYLTDLAHFECVNQIMRTYFEPPYPARAVVGVASLPRGALIEADGIMVFAD